MSIIERVVAHINLVGFESFEARAWQLFICQRCALYQCIISFAKLPSPAPARLHRVVCEGYVVGNAIRN